MVSVTVDCAKLVFGQNISFSAMMEGGKGKKDREKQRGGKGDTHRENGKRKRRRSKGKKEEGKEEEEKRKEGRKEGRKITAKKNSHWLCSEALPQCLARSHKALS